MVASVSRRPRSRSEEETILRQLHTLGVRGGSAPRRGPAEYKLTQPQASRTHRRTMITIDHGSCFCPGASGLRNGATTRLDLDGMVSRVIDINRNELWMSSTCLFPEAKNRTQYGRVIQ